MADSIKSEIVVTGAGVVLPGAENIESFWQRAFAGKTAVGKYESASVKCDRMPLYAGIAPEVLNRLRAKMPIRLRRFATAPTICAAGAVGQALNAAKIDVAEFGPKRIGFFAAQGGNPLPSLNSFAGAIIEAMEGGVGNEMDLELFAGGAMSRQKADPFTVIKGLGNNLLGVVSIAYGFKGDCGAFLHNDSGAAAALQHALLSLREGYCDAAVVAAAGSHDEAFTLAEQIKMNRVARDRDPRAFKVFDRDSRGTVLGEGACALILERITSATRRKIEPLAKIGGLVCRNEVHGESSAYKDCLGELARGMPGKKLSLSCIYSDATGVPDEDWQEALKLLTASSRHCRDAPVACLRPITGHHAAEGLLVDAAAALHTLKTGLAPPIAHLKTPISDQLNFVRNAPMRGGGSDVVVFKTGLMNFNSALWLKPLN